MTIEDMIGSIGGSVQAAHNMIKLGSVASFFENFFEEQNLDGNSAAETVYKPKTLKISMPSGENGEAEKIFIAPVAALVQHGSMNIDYVKLNLNVSVTDESGDSLKVSSQPLKDSNSSDLSGEMEIMFKCGDSPEGVARIETYMNSIL